MFCPAAARRDASASRSDGGGADRTFSRASRLRTRKLFLDVYDRGLRVNAAHFVLFGVPGATSRSRLGITATKKFGHAVARNRVRRIVRDVFRHSRTDADRPCDLVVNVKSSARGLTHGELAADLIAGVRELRRKLRR